jgi:hypothetical protein
MCSPRNIETQRTACAALFRAPQERRLPLPVEVVAYVGVAVGGIIPQAAVEWERLIKLIDPLAGIVDGRRNVRTRRRLGQRQRWCA